MAKLHNSLVDILVKVGLNEQTGLVPVPIQPESDKPYEEELYRTAFEPHILAAISADASVFPLSTSSERCRDSNYPPRKLETTSLGRGDAKKVKVKPQDTADQLTSLPEPVARLRATELQRTLSRKRSCRKMDFARRRALSNEADGNPKEYINKTDLPLPVDVLNSLTSLCFPDGAVCESSEPEASVHFLVLTDITGQRSYATCLTYYTQYDITKNSDGSYEVEPHESSSPAVVDDSLCFLPSCIVLVSKSPYFSLLKDLACRLLDSLKSLRHSSEIEKQLLQQAALQLCRTPVPPSGQLMLKFLYCDTTFTLHPPASHYRPVIDISLSLTFQYFTPETVLQILCCMLLQQRVIFLCSHYSLLTVIAESMLHLLHPFKWNMTYVPLLSWSILELVEAPGTFIMGCHSRHKHIIHMVEDVVIVDIDNGEIDFEHTSPLPAIPEYAAAEFIDKCRRLLYNSDTIRLNRATKFSYEAAWQAEHARQVAFNTSVTTAALEFHVDLFSGIIRHIKPEKGFFNKEKFLASLVDSEKPFYKAVMVTELFNSFLKERIAEKKDDWTIKEERMRSFYKSSLPLASFDALDKRRSRPTAKDLRKVKSASISDMNNLLFLSSGGKNESVVIQLPNFSYHDHAVYFEHCGAVLSRGIQECATSDRRAPFYLMLGLLRLADGKRVEALEDLQRLHSCDSRLLPDGIIRDVTRSLTDDEKNALQSSSILFKTVLKQRPKSMRSVSVVIDFNRLPKQEMDLAAFSKLVRALDIAVDMNIISRLYEALLIDKVTDVLLMDKHNKVQPEVFEEFYKCWKEEEMACDDVSNLVTDQLEQGEYVLKLSDTLKCSCGTGRIGLTQKRLFFLREGSNLYRRVALLRDIKHIERTTQKSFFSQLPAIRLDLQGSEMKTFTATVKDNQLLWHSILCEMCAGKFLSEEVRDPSIINLTSQNILIIDAFVAFAKDSEISCYYSNWEEKIPSLCYYTEQKCSDTHTMSPDTKEVLQHRINPNILESSPNTVECLLYTPGNKSTGVDADSDPRLVCGLSNGKICIFNASDWQIESSQSVSKDRVVSLLSVGQGCVWVASFDRKIYVISMETKSCHQTLRHHTDAVTDLCHGNNGNVIFSLSLNCEITEWNSQTSDVINSFHLSKYKCSTRLDYKEDKLFCCTRDEVVVTDTTGNVIQVLSYKDIQPQTPLPVKIACFLILPRNQLWVGCSRQGNILVYDLDTFKLRHNVVLPTSGITRMTYVNNQVWIGAKDGQVHVLDATTCGPVHTLHAHRDVIRCMCVALDRYVITGSASDDGTVMIWRTSPHDSRC